MNPQTSTSEKVCPRSELAAYIDGELLPREELELELHLASCLNCTAELNEQKKLLCVLDVALEREKEIELPANFTRVVVAAAESSVSGLRRPQERFKALFICAALFLVVLAGLGSETETVFGSFLEIRRTAFGSRRFCPAFDLRYFNRIDSYFAFINPVFRVQFEFAACFFDRHFIHFTADLFAVSRPKQSHLNKMLP